MHWSMPFVLTALLLFIPQRLLSQANAPRTLAVVAAHADDDGPVSSILARYAREVVHCVHGAVNLGRVILEATS